MTSIEFITQAALAALPGVTGRYKHFDTESYERIAEDAFNIGIAMLNQRAKVEVDVTAQEQTFIQAEIDKLDAK